VYSRISSPTRERAETLLGAIEGTPGQAAHAILYSSGLAASFAVLARLLPKRVAIQGGYHGTHQVLSQLQRISAGTACETVPLPAPTDLGARSPPSSIAMHGSPLRISAIAQPPFKRGRCAAILSTTRYHLDGSRRVERSESRCRLPPTSVRGTAAHPSSIAASRKRFVLYPLRPFIKLAPRLLPALELAKRAPVTFSARSDCASVSRSCVCA
jgi:hypothetical protein